MKTTIYFLELGYIQTNNEDFQENIIMYLEKEKAIKDLVEHIRKDKINYVEMWEQKEDITIEDSDNINSIGDSENVFIDKENETRFQA